MFFTLFLEYRNNGLGSLILQDFIKKANELNKPIFLDTFKSNPAKNFYEKKWLCRCGRKFLSLHFEIWKSYLIR